MSKKKRRNAPETADKSAADYYDLKTDAVERLVSEEEAPEVPAAEIEKYTSKKKRRIPAWLKITFVKFWFAGAVCYFFLWGLGMYIQGIELMVVLAIGLGVVTDLMTNRILRRFEPVERAYDKWIMVTPRRFWSIFVNVLYSGVVLYCVFKTYYIINVLMGVDPNVSHTEQEAMLGVEPILFGLLYLGFDMLLILAKNTLIKIFRDAEKKAGGSGKQNPETK